MALSDQLTKLAEQTRELEASATEIEAEDSPRLEARLATLQQSIDTYKNQLGDQMIQDGHDATDDWVTAQKNVSDAFNSIHAKAAARRAARRAKHAEAQADESEWSAEDAVEFAIYAVQEAEYALLQATADRETADDLKS